MLRSVCVGSAILFAGCASTRVQPPIRGASLMAPSIGAGADLPAAADPVGEPSLWSLARGDFELSIADRDFANAGREFDPSLAALGTPQAGARGRRQNRFTVKGGYYGSTEDGIDDGYIVNLSWMQGVSEFFAMEFEAGYLQADGIESGVDTDVWAIPLMVNGRVNLPISIFDIYAGLGFGTMYYDAKATGTFISVSADGFMLAGDAFVGATINLGDKLALGIEAKYYLTDDISDLDASLDAYAVMLTLGFRL